MINVAVVYPITVIFQRESRLDRQYVKTFFPELLSKGLPQGEIWMILAGLLVYQQAAVRSEAGHDVDVTFGTVQEVVSPQSLAKPDGEVCSQRAINAFGDAVSVVARVACWVQLYRGSEEHCALTIHMDAAALVDDLAALSGHRQDLGDLAGDGIVIVPLKLGVLAPSDELLVDGD